jgi:macrolide-specific efflux system membrane fusion protein
VRQENGLNTANKRPQAPWWRRWRGRLIVVGLLVVGGVGWRLMNPPKPPPPPPTGVVEKGDIQQVAQAAGVLQAKTRVDVGAQVSGQIRELHVQLGQSVKKGDLLVSLDPELARNDVAQAEAAMAQQRALLDARQVDLASARREAERQRRLLAGKATAGLEAERADNELAKLEADVRGQTAVMQRLQADLNRAQLRLGYTRITAPMDGTVVNLPVQVGQTVIAVQITPVMLTLADLRTITVRTKVPEVDIQSIKVGQKASFLTLSGQGQRYEGRVRVIQPVPERSGNAVFYNVLFDVDNASGQLFSDMTVQVDIETGEAKGVLTIPVVALGEREKDGRQLVTAIEGDNKQVPRKVRTGLQDGARVHVLEGLKLGEKVLLAPPSAASAPASAAAN